MRDSRWSEVLVVLAQVVSIVVCALGIGLLLAFIIGLFMDARIIFE